MPTFIQYVKGLPLPGARAQSTCMALPAQVVSLLSPAAATTVAK